MIRRLFDRLACALVHIDDAFDIPIEGDEPDEQDAT